eukprot:CAMPEP_0171171048 /NCGR_PEP_ID=MMETSP0790-20130122/9020_1 /TAXON_ID=2925 /ORGANISM="Alexandrium catenella, Strain OF101" /LENGTH=350 /DNA_ID=CAMNT_0011635897 /DNA_START=73 /DNA_END=1125 /DNA_ORIENTATION=+
MARMPSVFLVASVALASSASGLRQRRGSCGEDDVNFAEIALYTGYTNWDLRNSSKWEKSGNVGDHDGCWERMAYNTDMYMSSTVYQNKQDGRCVLGFSGYHGRLAGYVRAIFDLTMPPETQFTCGRMLFSPYVKLLRHHTGLGNWSKLVRLFAGPDRVCEGELTLTGHSMGGSVAEMLAWCGNNGSLAELQDASLPNYTIETLFTFGAPATAAEPLTNTLREDGCFKGRRIFFDWDPIEKFNRMFNVKHPHMDAVMIYPGQQPAVKVFGCDSQQAVSGTMYGNRPPPIPTHDALAQSDLASHSIESYRDTLKYMNAHDLAGLFDALPTHSQSNASVAAQYLAMFSKRSVL